jgi:hypothetical protein
MSPEIPEVKIKMPNDRAKVKNLHFDFLFWPGFWPAHLSLEFI